MMTHEQARERLDDFLDGGLSPAERTGFEAHLAGCPECRSAVETWRRISHALLRAPAVGRDEAFVRRVMARIAEPRPRFLPWLAPAFGLAAASLAILLAWPGAEPASAEAALIEDDDVLIAVLEEP